MRPDFTPLAFGRHKGKTPSEVSIADPGYVVWLHDTIGAHMVSKGLYEDARHDAEEDESAWLDAWDFRDS